MTGYWETTSRLRGIRWIGFSALLLLGSVVGCLGRSPDVRYYMLGTQSGPQETLQTSELAVLIGPVRLPGYLQRSQIARRAQGGEIKLDEFNRWLGGFEPNWIRALSADVRRLLGSERVVGYPSQPPFPIDYSVRIHIDDWVVDESNRLSVKLRWAIVRAAQEKSPVLSTYEDEFAIRGGSVKDLVEAHDRALDEVARKLADQLMAVSDGRRGVAAGPGG